MQEVTQIHLTDALTGLGIKRGDGLLVHSAIHFLGNPRGGLEMYLLTLSNLLGISLQKEMRQFPPGGGTLVVPTFNFDFARGEPFDAQKTPSKGMGVFSEYVRCHPQAVRTSHPMQSLAAIGTYAVDLAERDTPSAFDTGSAFERMLELDFKILLLGADVQAISLLHYCEQRANVPYRYWKDFEGEVRMRAGWETRTYPMFVRDLELDPNLDIRPVQALLENRHQWFSISLNYGMISLCRMVDFVSAVDEFLSADPWSLVTNRPKTITRN